MKQLIVTNKAIKDIEIAKKWYDEQQEYLGSKFADCIFKSFNEIQQQSLSFPNKYKYTREMYIKKFPYTIIYSIEENIIFILRVFHCKINPNKKYT